MSCDVKQAPACSPMSRHDTRRTPPLTGGARRRLATGHALPAFLELAREAGQPNYFGEKPRRRRLRQRRRGFEATPHRRRPSPSNRELLIRRALATPCCQAALRDFDAAATDIFDDNTFSGISPPARCRSMINVSNKPSCLRLP